MEPVGASILTATPNLVAYTGWPVVTLEEALVTVTAWNKIKKLMVFVIYGTAGLLFGLNWALAFEITFTPSIWICSSSKQTRAIGTFKEPMCCAKLSSVTTDFKILMELTEICHMLQQEDHPLNSFLVVDCKQHLTC